MKMTTENLILEAIKLADNSCANFCMHEAIHRYKSGYKSTARNWALKSIAYSVGINHPVYTQNC